VAGTASGGRRERPVTAIDVAAAAGVSVATVSRTVHQPERVSEATRRRVQEAIERLGYRAEPLDDDGGEAAVRITQVARAAGVSISTVSRVVNRPDTVLAETRERVQEAIERLGYRPNRVASGLRSGLTRTGALLVADVSQPWYAKLTKAVEAELDRWGYTAYVYDLDHDAANLARYLEGCPQQGVEGVILSTGDRLDAAAEAALERVHARIPVVLASQQLDRLEIPSVVYDDRGGARAATEHLLAGGAAPVAFLGELPRSHLGEERCRGYADALRAAGEDARGWRWPVRGYDYRHGFDATGAALAAGRVPGGILAVNDQLAIGAMRALHDHGLTVPGDVAVVGFGDLELAPFVRPSLSSVQGPVDEIAASACSALVALLRDEPAPQRQVIGRSLVVRESSRRGG